MYLEIITTVLVATQVIRLIQNTVNLYRQNKLIKAQLAQIDDVTDKDFEMQRKAYRYIVEFFEKEMEREDED